MMPVVSEKVSSPKGLPMVVTCSPTSMSLELPMTTGGQAGGLHLDDSDVVGLLAAHIGGGILLTVREGHLDGVGPVNDVVVGEDVAVLGDDKAGAAAAPVTVWPKMLVLTMSTVMPTQELTYLA